MAIDDDRVERLFTQFRQALSTGQDMDLPHMQALVERFRVELLIADVSARRRRVYRAIIDMFEDLIDEKVDKLDAQRPKGSNALIEYVRRLMQGIS